MLIAVKIIPSSIVIGYLATMNAAILSSLKFRATFRTFVLSWTPYSEASIFLNLVTSERNLIFLLGNEIKDPFLRAAFDGDDFHLM